MQDRFRPQPSGFIKTINSESFIEKALLLIITVILTGFLIPYITNEIQRTKSQNEVILKAQSELIDDVSKTLMAYETLLMDIAWYKTPNGKNDTMHRKAYERYSQQSVDLLTQFRVESIKAKQLASNDIGNKLDSFQNRILNEQDLQMSILRNKKNATPQEWVALQDKNVEMLEEAKSLISTLSKQMGITRSDIK